MVGVTFGCRHIYLLANLPAVFQGVYVLHVLANTSSLIHLGVLEGQSQSIWP